MVRFDFKFLTISCDYKNVKLWIVSLTGYRLYCLQKVFGENNGNNINIKHSDCCVR